MHASISRPTASRLLRCLLAAGTLAGLVVSGAGAGEAGGATAGASPTWTSELQMRFREVSSTAISRDGSLVAFVVREPVMEEESSEYREQVWLARADGSDLRQLTWRDQSSTSPAFSPDGRTLAFLSKKPGGNGGNGNGDEGPRTQVWAMRLDGGEAREVTASESGVTAFAWSPSGDRIAFLAPDPESEEEKQAKKEKRWVEVVDSDFELARLWVTPFDGSAHEPAEAKQLGDEGGIHVTDLDWSPDGAAIVLAHQPDPRLNTGMIAGDLSVVEVASGARRPLVAWEGRESQPRWSPDGRSIAFVSHGGAVERVGLGDVFVVDAAGGAPRSLAHTPDREASLVGWTQAGELLIAESWRTERGLYLLPADGAPPRRIDRGGGVLASASLAAEAGAVAFVHEEPSTPEEVFVAQLGGFVPRRLSELHREVELPPMGRTEKLSWRSPDGAEIEGLLTYPVGYREGERVPLVLDIHGGPSGVFRETFTGAPSIYMLQTFAQQGYAILRPNPRGSTGYGKDFRYANVRDWCQGDYDDVISGVDAVIARGVADPDRLFVMGWSYGGYMTSCVVSRTDRFRAASMGAGLPNLVSMVHTTDIPDYLVAHQGGKELWEDYESYMRHSAMFRLGEIVTPTQILHGEKDLRVPLGQGQELYVALSRKGVPTEMAVYPRTPHGPREPKLLMDVTPRILAWFDRFLPASEGAAPTGGD
jgi:dipeptidyl aminopeptidase/acylaminoacyl peptidase